MKYFVRVSTIFLIFFFIQMSTFISCEDTTSSVDNTDTTVTIWTKENSPYIVSDTMIVDRESKLIIEAGVIVKFNDYSALVVEGELWAEGNNENNIVFTAIEDDFGPYHEDSWVGIMFDSCASDKCLMKYCKIEKSIGWAGLSPVLIKNCSPTISHCTFESYLPLWDTGGSYIQCVGDSEPLLEYNCIPRLISAYRGSGIRCTKDANPSIFYNNIEYDGVDECWAVDGGGFLDGNYLFSIVDNDTTEDFSLGIPVDEEGDGVCSTNSTNEPPGFINVDGVRNPQIAPNELD